MSEWSVDLPSLAYLQSLESKLGTRPSAPPPVPKPVTHPAPKPAPKPAPPKPKLAPDVLKLNQWAALPPGHGKVIIPPGTRVESRAGQAPGAGFEGRVATQTRDTLAAAGGLSYLYTSPPNGNREVAVYAAPGFDASKPYTVLVADRGINGDNAQTLTEQHMARAMREMNAQGRNVLLVLPQPPAATESWFAPPEDANAMIHEALDKFSSASGVKLGKPQETWLIGHSGGGAAVMNTLNHANAPHFDKVMLADCTYGYWAANTADTLQRMGASGPRLAVVVTDHNNARATSQLGSRGIPVDHQPDGIHDNVAEYMLNNLVGNHPTLAFSHFDGNHWGQDGALTIGTSHTPVAAILRKGDSGPQVAALQRKLNEKGFHVSADGDFGPQTLAAVQAFQKQQGLTSDGVVGPQTRKKLGL